MEEEEKKDYEILGEAYPSYDFSFKIIVIGNSGMHKLIFNILKNRSGKIIFIDSGSKTYF